MSAWLYLLLAHLVGDFILQPYELVKLKQRPIGLGIHSGIHAILVAVLTAPAMPRWWAAAIIVGVTHYIIDLTKVRGGSSQGPASLAAFLLDQVAHLVVLAAVIPITGYPLHEEVPFAYAGTAAILFYAIPYVTATFAGAILLYQFALAYRTRSRPEDLLMPWPRLAGYVERGAVLTLVLFGNLWLLWIGVVWYGLRFALGLRRAGLSAEAAVSGALTLVMGLLFRQGVNL